ncbi:MAG: nitroreductase family protein [Peptostreptococcaceae bacterium]|nr:nitroreductase family protein [Peptostreptococcaceae bacterium]
MIDKNITIEECIFTRRSIRSFTDQKPPFTAVKQLVKCASMAPSGSNIQSWEFIFVDDKEILETIRNFAPGINGKPPCILILCSDKKRAYEKGGTLVRDQIAAMDISMAAENLMLAANAMGLGTCAVKSFNSPLIAKILKLPEHIFPELIIALGYSDRSCTAPKRRPVEEILHHNKWENGEGNNNE